ncbi:unnamed protein product [Lactuca saligna]|uniref:Uncharacterized protein n=1 Tax=Lactuca saligna TaxID=75948 RepID=A0AA35V8A5_LACSI|nr:unnamed protein product [Lactuca saligna]
MRRTGIKCIQFHFYPTDHKHTSTERRKATTTPLLPAITLCSESVVFLRPHNRRPPSSEQVDRGDQLPLGLPQKLYRSIIITYLESRYGVLFKKERDNRAYMEGLSQGIHSKAHADGVGLKTIVRDINLHCLETWQGFVQLICTHA